MYGVPPHSISTMPSPNESITSRGTFILDTVVDEQQSQHGQLSCQAVTSELVHPLDQLGCVCVCDGGVLNEEYICERRMGVGGKSEKEKI